MTMPGWRDWLFSFKTFAAAMLALYIAMAGSLPRPYWAMATVYICSQPLSGATRSKAVYRTIGTIIGATVAVVLVPNLVNAPVLLCTALALWIGIALYFSLLDRSPRSYTFMLGGYTAAMIGFPAVLDPGSIFDTAVARVEEITLGICCASLLSSVAWPYPVGAVASARATSWIRNVAQLFLDTLEGKGSTDKAKGELVRLAGDAADLDILSAHLTYDTSGMGDVMGHIHAIRTRMLALLPVMSSVIDRVKALGGESGALPPSVQPSIEALRRWVNLGPLRMGLADRAKEHAEVEQIRVTIETDLEKVGKTVDWNSILAVSLLLRLRDMLDIASDIRILRRAARTHRRHLDYPLAYDPGTGDAPIRHRDHVMALWSAGATVLAILLCCWFWIETGWPDGSAAPMMAAVACCFFAARDDPAPAILQFAHGTAIAVVIIAVYQFAILPQVHVFEALAFVMAPTFLIFGVLVANPRTAGLGLALAANGATILALQGTYSADFAAYANSNLSLLLGMYAGAITIRLTRSVGAEWATWRLVNASRAAMGQAAVGRGAASRTQFATLMLDRIGLIAPRLASIGPGSNIGRLDLLGGLRIGLNVIDLRRGRHDLPPDAHQAVDHLLAILGERFRTRYRQPTPALLEAIDDTFQAVAPCTDSKGRRDVLIGLVGLRRGLFPEAPPLDLRPPQAPEPERVAA